MRPIIFAILAFANACSGDGRDGPTPELQAIEPAALCTAQKAAELVVRGTGLTPAVVKTLAGGEAIEMPTIRLAIGGVTVFTAAQTDVMLPLGESKGKRLTTRLPIGVVGPTNAGEAVVAYDVIVKNPNGNEGRLPGAFVVVPPPDVTGLGPKTAPAGAAVSVTLVGKSLRDGLSVTLMASPPSTATAVTVSSDTSATITLDLTNVAAGDYDILVKNAEGCSVTLVKAFNVASVGG